MIHYERSDLGLLSKYMKNHNLNSLHQEIVDIIDSSFTVSEIRSQLQEYFSELYYILFVCSLNELPKWVNSPYNFAAHWRLSRGI
jgi:hypothetical protein